MYIVLSHLNSIAPNKDVATFCMKKYGEFSCRAHNLGGKIFLPNLEKKLESGEGVGLM